MQELPITSNEWKGRLYGLVAMRALFVLGLGGLFLVRFFFQVFSFKPEGNLIQVAGVLFNKFIYMEIGS